MGHIFLLHLDFSSIIIIDIIGQVKYELYVYFFPFILLVLLLLVSAGTAARSFPFQSSVNVHFRALLISSEQSLSWAQGPWLVTTWNGKGKGSSQRAKKQLETIEESYRNKSMRNKSKNMIKAWYPVSQNILESLSCPFLGNSLKTLCPLSTWNLFWNEKLSCPHAN